MKKILLVGLVVLGILFVSYVANSAPTQTKQSNQEVTKAKVEKVPYNVVGTVDGRLTKTYYVLDETLNPSDKDLKENVKKIITSVAADHGTEISVSVVNNKEVAEYRLGSTFDQSKLDLAKSAQIASYEGGISLNATKSTNPEDYQIFWFPATDTSDPNVGSLVGHETWKPQV